MVFFGYPGEKIYQIIYSKYQSYTDDTISKKIDEKVTALPVEKQVEIQEKIEELQEQDPTIADSSDDVETLKITEVAIAKGLDVQSILGKSEARTDDDNIKLLEATNNL